MKRPRNVAYQRAFQHDGCPRCTPISKSPKPEPAPGRTRLRRGPDSTTKRRKTTAGIEDTGWQRKPWRWRSGAELAEELVNGPHRAPGTQLSRVPAPCLAQSTTAARENRCNRRGGGTGSTVASSDDGVGSRAGIRARVRRGRSAALKERASSMARRTRAPRVCRTYCAWRRTRAGSEALGFFISGRRRGVSDSNVDAHEPLNLDSAQRRRRRAPDGRVRYGLPHVPARWSHPVAGYWRRMSTSIVSAATRGRQDAG